MASEQQLRHRSASQSDGNVAITGDCQNDDIGDRRRRKRKQPRRPLLFFLHLVVRFFSRFPATWRTYRRWRSTRLRDFGAALPADDGNDFPQRNRPLPTDKALSALGLANCRDVASACRTGDVVVPGRLFRSSSPFALSYNKRAGEDDNDDDDSDVSAAAAAEKIARLLSHAATSTSSSPSPSSSSSSSSRKGLNLTLVIDLRSDNEWEQGKGDAVVEALSRTRGREKGNGNGNNRVEVDKETNDKTTTTSTTIIKVERVPLQEWQRYLFAFVARLPLDRALGAASHFVLFKFILRYKPPLPGMHSRLCFDTERGGILAMNTTILAAFPLEIARVLRLITSALSSDSSSSVMIACKLGKDRTGMISAICLTIAGASLEDVVEDYSRSAVELFGRPPPATAPSLGGSPRVAMERTLEWLAEHWRAPKGEVESYRRREEEEERKRGVSSSSSSFSSSSSPARYCWRSGVIGYLEHEARFLAHEREALRRALTEK